MCSSDLLSYPVMPILIHGDAAFAGQGVVAECLAMCDIAGYRIGGTVHVIINNQIGFTTSPEYSRSSPYCSDVAKTVQAPIFHVNGDDPEACLRVARLAFEYRQAFHKDVVIDIVCYRRHGHNEGDDPSYTQPQMYKNIAQHRPIAKLYVEELVSRGALTLDEAEQMLNQFQNRLQTVLDDTRAHLPAHAKAPKPPTPVGVLPWIETAEAIVNLNAICRASERIVAVAFGGEDFTNDMGIERLADESQIAYARQALCITARAAHVLALDTPYFKLRDPDGLRLNCTHAKSIGFKGKFAIHPEQLDALNECFSPSPAEIAHAERVVAAFEEAERRGRGSTSLDGWVIDVPVVKRARALLDLARRIREDRDR